MSCGKYVGRREDDPGQVHIETTSRQVSPEGNQSRDPKWWAVSAAIAIVLVVILGGGAYALYGTLAGESNSNLSESIDGGQQVTSEDPYAPSNSEQESTANSDTLDPSDFDAPNFEVQQTSEMVSMNDVDGGLYVQGNADFLYEEDIAAIADYLGAEYQDYDYVEAEIFRVPSSETGSFQRAGECASASIVTANNYDGSMATNVREGYFEYTCDGGDGY